MKDSATARRTNIEADSLRVLPWPTYRKTYDIRRPLIQKSTKGSL